MPSNYILNILPCPALSTRTVRLMITPQTKVNISDNEKWLTLPNLTNLYLFKVGVKKQREDTEKKRKKITSMMYYIRRREYILNYLEYKRRLKEVFIKSGFGEFPQSAVWFKFFLPMPKSWSKKKRNSLCFQPHVQTPDTSNFHKAMEDSCSEKDSVNWDYRASKFWIDAKDGYIEIETGSLPPAIGYRKLTTEDILK